jgi:hypothetical protein
VNRLKPYAKSVVPLVIGFVVSILQAIAKGGVVNWPTLAAALATLLTSASVYMVPNRPATK